MKKQIEKVRKWVGKLTVISKGNKLTSEVIKFIKIKSVTSALNTQKMILVALVKKLNVRVANRKRYNNNNLFWRNENAFMPIYAPATKRKQINHQRRKKFQTCGDHSGVLEGHIINAKWLKDEKEDMKSINRAIWEDFTTDTLTQTTRKIPNWKAPAIDQVQNFWLKHLKSMHPALTAAS